MADNSSDSSKADNGRESPKPGEGAGKKLGTAAQVAGYGLKLANGDYDGIVKSAVQDVTMKIVTTDTGQEALKKGVESVAGMAGRALPLAEKAGLSFAQKIPVVGAIATAVPAAMAVAGKAEAAINGQASWGSVASEAAARTAQVVGNMAGFGVGDVAQEGVGLAVKAGFGEQYAPSKSGLREMGEQVYALVTGKPDTPHPHKSGYARTASFAETVDGKSFTGSGIPNVMVQFQDAASPGYGVYAPGVQPSTPAVAAGTPTMVASAPSLKTPGMG